MSQAHPMNKGSDADVRKRCAALAQALEADAAKLLMDKTFKTVRRQGYEYFSDEENVRPEKIAAALDRFDLAKRLRALTKVEDTE